MIKYLPTGAGDIDEATVIYHDPATLMLPVPRWVLDGQAYLLHTPDGNTATLVFRDGGLQTIQMPAAVGFITATPDGWLMQGTTTYRLSCYQYREGGLSYTEINGIAGRHWEQQSRM